jgi:hypothetical protein
MVRHGQETVIFLDNNRGYVSESFGGELAKRGN